MTKKQEKKEINEPQANLHAIPRITKVIVNVGVGKNRDDKNYIAAVTEDLKKITGQHPRTRTARQAVAGFNVRQGNLVGLCVTLRGKRKDDFTTRFVNITLPRVRDFRGISTTAIDKQGNLNIGLEEQLAFPEINPEKTDIVFGLQVTFVTSTKNIQAAGRLFTSLGFPLVRNRKILDL